MSRYWHAKYDINSRWNVSIEKDVAYLFDYKIFVDTNFEIARKRGAKRETEAFEVMKKQRRCF